MGRFTKPIPFVPWFGPFSESWLPAVSPAKYECDVKNLTHNSGYYKHRWWQYKWQEHKSAQILPLDHLSVDKSTDVSKHGTNYKAWLSNKILHFVTRLFHHVFYNSLQCNYTAKFTLNVFCSWFRLHKFGFSIIFINLLIYENWGILVFSGYLQNLHKVSYLYSTCFFFIFKFIYFTYFLKVIHFLRHVCICLSMKT